MRHRTLARHRLDGLERVDADAGAIELDTEQVRVTVEGGFARAVGTLGRAHGRPRERGWAWRQIRATRRDIDDPAFTSLAHRWDDGLGQIDRCVEVHLEHDPTMLQAQLGGGSVDAGSGIVDQHVDRSAEKSLALAGDTSTIIGISQIRDQRKHHRAVAGATLDGLIETAGQLLGRIERAGSDHDAGALGRIPLGNTSPDATACPGNDDPTARESPHRRTLMVRRRFMMGSTRVDVDDTPRRLRTPGRGGTRRAWHGYRAGTWAGLVASDPLCDLRRPLEPDRSPVGTRC